MNYKKIGLMVLVVVVAIGLGSITRSADSRTRENSRKTFELKKIIAANPTSFGGYKNRQATYTFASSNPDILNVYEEREERGSRGEKTKVRVKVGERSVADALRYVKSLQFSGMPQNMLAGSNAVIKALEAWQGGDMPEVPEEEKTSQVVSRPGGGGGNGGGRVRIPAAPAPVAAPPAAAPVVAEPEPELEDIGEGEGQVVEGDAELVVEGDEGVGVGLTLGDVEDVEVDVLASPVPSELEIGEMGALESPVSVASEEEEDERIAV